MDASDSSALSHSHAVTGHEETHHEESHHELGWMRKYWFSTDHKTIGLQYLLTGLTFLMIGFCFILLMRWQIAFPGQPLTLKTFGANIGLVMSGKSYQEIEEILKKRPAPADLAKENGTPLVASVFGESRMPDGVMKSDFYNSLGAMHGTIMVFLAIVPLAFAAFGNFVMPLQIGAPDMTFPRVNMASYHAYFWGGLIMLASIWLPDGSAKSGWTSYAPLADIADIHDVSKSLSSWDIIFTGQTIWLIGMVFLITSSLLGAVNFIATIIQLRCAGMTWMRLPFFVWAQFVTAFLLLLAFPPLEAASVLQLVDRVGGSSFFLPSGLSVNGKFLTQISGGGSPILWQHLFWFLGHPEVYVLILPGLGIVCEVIANNTRKPIWGYKSLVYALLVLGFLSFVVWAHHMYLTGMGSKVSTFFQTTTIIISIPSVIILTALLISLWGGSIRFTVPMLFATAFIPLFGIGGLTGIPLAFNAPDLYLHDTYYVIAHFHYIVAPGTIFALFAGVYHWFPKATGRMMNDFWGKVHFWPSMILMNCIFMPMFLQGMAGMHRRWYDGGLTFDELMKNVLHWNQFISISAFLMLLAQIPFIINFFHSIWHGEKAGTNPWHATTLEWQTSSPPPHGNFPVTPHVYRGPYEYSVPGHPTDYTPQNMPESPERPNPRVAGH